MAQVVIENPVLNSPYDEPTRHFYFTDEGITDKIVALRAEIDESTWSTLYSATSRPFDAPKTGKIAVKVINHYGDEVLKIFPISGASADQRKR